MCTTTAVRRICFLLKYVSFPSRFFNFVLCSRSDALVKLSDVIEQHAPETGVMRGIKKKNHIAALL